MRQELPDFGVRAGVERWGSKKGEISSVCLALSLLAFQGRGHHFETFVCTKKKKPSRLFPFSFFLEQRSSVSCRCHGIFRR